MPCETLLFRIPTVLFCFHRCLLKPRRRPLRSAGRRPTATDAREVLFCGVASAGSSAESPAANPLLDASPKDSLRDREGRMMLGKSKPKISQQTPSVLGR